jgi:hypothetical protein
MRNCTKLILNAALIVLAIGAQLAVPRELHGQGVSFGRGPGITFWAPSVAVTDDHSTGFGEGPGIVLPAGMPLARADNTGFGQTGIVGFGQGAGIVFNPGPSLLVGEPALESGILAERPSSPTPAAESAPQDRPEAAVRR